MPSKTTSPHPPTALFTHSENCVACHNNLLAPSGEDLSIGTAWRSTIMANAARDPYFFASVRRETMDHPQHAAAIQDECATCHVPMAQRAAHMSGRLAVVLDDGAGTPTDRDHLASDGVSCTVCHQIASESLGTPASFNGNFPMRPARADGVREVFGPFAVDKGRHTIMRSVTGFEQVEAPHVKQSELCATCHTLITEAFDREGRVVGSLPEQMNYQEWRHSAFYDEGRSCQSCHMPRATGPLRVSSVLGAERDGLSRHVFVGGNAFMLRLLNLFRTELGVEAPSEALEATARLTEQQLRNDTATIEIASPVRAADSVQFDVVVRNLTGHKFPTGYPSRRAWLHVTVADDQGRVIFESGAVSPSGAITGNDSDADPATFEPHYDVIERPEQVEIYESIMGDTASAPTTGLLTAVKYLKDNRLLPRGFEKQTATADIAVFGSAAGDASFVGGIDRIRYVVQAPSGRRTGRITVELLYQPIAYRWAQNLKGYPAPEPSRFVEQFDRLSSASSTVVATAIREE
ncbi:MAG: hypothetical protein ABI652_08755 [Acidobacteriota bacterium]